MTTLPMAGCSVFFSVDTAVTNRTELCWWYSQCWGRRWTQLLSTRYLSNGLQSVSQVGWRQTTDALVN